MRIVPTTCDNCSAPIEVRRGHDSAACDYCGSKLAITRSAGGETATRLLEETQAELRNLKIGAAVDRLDREWDDYRRSMMIPRKDGSLSRPTRAGAAFGTVIAVVFGVFWTVMAASIAPPMAIFGVIFIAVGVFGGILTGKKAGVLDRRRAAYRRRRRELLSGRDD